MEMNKQIITEEDLIAFIAEGMEPIKPEEQAAIDEDEDGYTEEYVSEDEIARENGFWVDEDGHWRELDEDDIW